MRYSKFHRFINEGKDVESLVGDLLAAYGRGNEDKIIDAWMALFEETVPRIGTADTVGGEIVRAVNQIMHRRVNDGDCIGVDSGNDTCNAPARYLKDITNNRGISKLIDRMWGRDYGVKDVYWLGEVIAGYLSDNLDLFSKKNRDNMWKWKMAEDEDWGYEDEDDWD